MEKAYDLKDLGERLKKIGLPVLEETAEQVYHVVQEWVVDSAALSENKLDDVIVPIAMPIIDKVVEPAMEKISE